MYRLGATERHTAHILICRVQRARSAVVGLSSEEGPGAALVCAAQRCDAEVEPPPLLLGYPITSIETC